jgi:hypothetical protein
MCVDDIPVSVAVLYSIYTGSLPILAGTRDDFAVRVLGRTL